MKKKELLMPAIIVIFCLLGFHQTLNAQGFQLEINSSQYERFIQEAKESEGVSSEELARFYSQNLSIRSLAKESIDSRLIIFLMDSEGSVLNEIEIQADQLSNRPMRLGRLISSSRIAGILEEGISGSEWFPSRNWVRGSQPVIDSADELKRVAEQLAIKVTFQPERVNNHESYSLVFAMVPGEGQFDEVSPGITAFSILYPYS